VSYDELPDYALGEYRVPSLSATAARGKDGKLYASVANLNPREAAEISLSVAGAPLKRASAQVLTADAMGSHNTFAEPGAVQPKPFGGIVVKGDTLKLTLPARAIVMIAID
jgi:alpha-N-arabinofuranosidase